jgi:hypothetical protein
MTPPVVLFFFRHEVLLVGRALTDAATTAAPVICSCEQGTKAS